MVMIGTWEIVEELLLSRFSLWLDSHGLGTYHTFALVTDGPFDVGRFLRLAFEQVGEREETEETAGVKRRQRQTVGDSGRYQETVGQQKT